ncbi:MAG: hypothetical protein K6F14_06945 [Clostridiales bacterium]|nr:hypothetical protein [Clostridiales bacterium]
MKKFVKSKGVMVSSIISLLLSLIVLATVSMAWLSMNTNTNSNGMKLNVEVTPNLIINSNSSTLQSRIGPTESDFSVTFSNLATSVTPATHSTDYTSHSTGLKCLTKSDMGDVNPSTGLKNSGSFAFANAVSGTNFVDFTVYIASTGEAMNNMDLNAAFSAIPNAPSISGDGTYKDDTLKASSIDFYVTSVSSGNYKGTINVAGFSASANDYTTALTSVNLLSNGTIPLNSSSYITVIMRCYVDGALLKSDGQAFINTAKIDVGDITLNVTFTATEHS